MPLTIQSNVDLSNYNTMAVPAKASHLVEVHSIAELGCAVDYAQKSQLPILILGQGSNTLFVDDFDGLIIVNRVLGIESIVKDQSVSLKVASGENWHQLVEHCLQNQWYGLENLALIPGLVGASPIQNIGAYGVELKDVLESVEYYDIATKQFIELTVDECQFGYRDSIFKHQLKDKVIITAINLKLSLIAEPKITYPALVAALAEVEQITPQHVFDAVCQLRQQKLPNPDTVPNLGSFFKNPIVDKSTVEALQNQYPEIPVYPFNQDFKLSAAWLIDYAGWKDKQLDGVKVYQKQALVLTNPQKQSGTAVFKAAQAIQADILEKFGISLIIEPTVVS